MPFVKREREKRTAAVDVIKMLSTKIRINTYDGMLLRKKIPLTPFNGAFLSIFLKFDK